MMEWNDSLLWLSGVMTLLLALRHLRIRPAPRRWLILLGTVAASIVGGLLFWPDYAGYLSMTLLVLLVFLPVLAHHLVFVAIDRGYVQVARIAARIVAVLHPHRGTEQMPLLVDALSALREGHFDKASEWLRQLSHEPTPIGCFALALQVRQSGQWTTFLDWLSKHPHRHELLANAHIVDVYLQALGELGHPAEMLNEFAHRIGKLPHPPSRLHVCAFWGRDQPVMQICQGSLASWSDDVLDFWQATAQQAAGKMALASDTFEKLRTSRHALIRVIADRRLQSPVPVADPTHLNSHQQAVLQAIEKDVDHDYRFGVLTSTPRRRPYLTWILAAILTVMFTWEMREGSENGANLAALGAIVIPRNPTTEQLAPPLFPPWYDPPYDDWWRPITASFLHYGTTHFLFNVLALLVLGRLVERAWGPWLTLFGYGLTTIVSMEGAAWLLEWRFAGQPSILAGASGGIMGLLGCLWGMLLIGLVQHRTAAIVRQASLVGLLILLQVLFDLTHEQISYQAHLLGLVCGCLIGLSVGVGMTVRPRRIFLARPSGDGPGGESSPGPVNC